MIYLCGFNQDSNKPVFYCGDTLYLLNNSTEDEKVYELLYWSKNGQRCSICYKFDFIYEIPDELLSLSHVEWGAFAQNIEKYAKIKDLVLTDELLEKMPEWDLDKMIAEELDGLKNALSVAQCQLGEYEGSTEKMFKFGNLKELKNQFYILIESIERLEELENADQ